MFSGVVKDRTITIEVKKIDDLDEYEKYRIHQGLLTRHSKYFSRLIEGVKQDDGDGEVDKEAEDDDDDYLHSLKGNESDTIRLSGAYYNRDWICEYPTAPS